jgi:hypothetical protein
MAVARPILLLGPSPCHVTDILDEHRVGWRIAHGDVDAAVRVLREIVATGPGRLREMGERARLLVTDRFSKAELLGRFCDLI